MANTVHDPVCGMDIDPATAAGTSEYKGQTYYFCSPGCKKSFDKDPEKYVGQSDHEHHHKDLYCLHENSPSSGRAVLIHASLMNKTYRTILLFQLRQLSLHLV